MSSEHTLWMGDVRHTMYFHILFYLQQSINELQKWSDK